VHLTPRKTARRFAPGAAVSAVLLAVATALTAGCSVAPAPIPRVPVVQIPTQTAGLAATAPDGRGAIRPLPAPTGCARTASDPAAAQQALIDAVPGDRVCITGDLSGWRLRVLYSGTAQAPIQVVGDGDTRVGGIEIEALNVVVDGFTVLNAASPEISIKGDNVTLSNTVARNPIRPGSDNVQLTGTGITLSHNTLGQGSGDGGNASHNGSKANCVDVFTADSDATAANHVRIVGNRCENTAINCLRVTGDQAADPGDDASDKGRTADIEFTDNYCQTRGDAGVFADNAQNLTITGNEVATADHAWTLRNHSTGAKISGNTLAPGTRYELAMDDSSRDDYQGPPATGATP
jgi:hypothetical protein